jgi:hypothetical protein
VSHVVLNFLFSATIAQQFTKAITLTQPAHRLMKKHLPATGASSASANKPIRDVAAVGRCFFEALPLRGYVLPTGGIHADSLQPKQTAP